MTIELYLIGDGAQEKAISLVESIEEGQKTLCELLYVIRLGEFYDRFGCKSFAELVENRFRMSHRRAMWMVGTWERAKQLSESGCEWVAELPWSSMVEILRMPDEEIRNRVHLGSASLRDIREEVEQVRKGMESDYVREDVEEKADIIRCALDGTGVDSAWLMAWLRDYEEEVRFFLGPEGEKNGD